jgi:hypothetical protein
MEQVKAKIKRVYEWLLAKSKGSLTILMSRAQYVIGILIAAVVSVFSDFQWSSLTYMGKREIIIALVAMIASAVIAEVSRRRTL